MFVMFHNIGYCLLDMFMFLDNAMSPDIPSIRLVICLCSL